MAIQARVTSTEALESFRASLIVFITKARVSVDDVSDEVRRMRSWLQNDQPRLWESEIKKRSKKLEQAQAELQSAQFAGGRESAVMVRQAAVNRAKQAVAEAEDKLRRIKKWSMNYDNATSPIAKKMESFREIVMTDLPKAVAHLDSVQRALEAYAEISAPAGSSGPAIASAPSDPAATGEPAKQPEAAPTTEAHAT